jgi:glutathione S-transferase
LLTLYFAPGASSMAPHIALYEVGADFDAIPLSFARNDNRRPDYLAINPLGQVPTLMIDGRPLTEVAGILFYLARTYPQAELLPEGLEDQARVVSWMSYIAATLHPARRQGLEHARKIYREANARLGANDWTVAGRCSIADIHLFRLFWRFNSSVKPPAEEFPNLIRLHDRMLQRAAVQKTIAAESTIGYELPGQRTPERKPT